MTSLEMLLFFIIYLIMGIWICNKREFYTAQCITQFEGFLVNLCACVFMPINLLIVIFKEFILRKWNN